ncbi:regulator of G-protein signaling 7-binding protein-like [Oratosquilla oratoria]|uniref:regulator of G-protein signaling 7-binding protein-like n=1 Tax=Oratosquilla oratoria TaxID=337810 RepID=UPI003F762115
MMIPTQHRHLIRFYSQQLVHEINQQVALFRDLLICVGQPRDGPELRERIRKVRRQCVETCKHSSGLLLPGIKSDVAEGIPVDNQNFVHLVSCTQLMARELRKCRRLVQTMPIDMTEYYENKPGPSGMGGLGVISQLLLCKSLQPDFQQEEICSIDKDMDDIGNILHEMQEYMPQEDTSGRTLALTGEDVFSLWSKKRSRRTFYRNMSSLCCTCKPAYL